MHAVHLIVDEFAAGYGRTGTLFACEQEGVSPDSLCLATGISGGYLPLVATLMTEAAAAGAAIREGPAASALRPDAAQDLGRAHGGL